MNQLHLPDQTSRREGLALGLARGPSFLQMKFWLDTRLELLAPVPTRRAQGLDLGLARGPQFPPEEVLALLSFFCFFDPCRPGGCNVWLGLARGFFAWRLSSLEPVATSRRFGFGFGSRPKRLIVGWRRILIGRLVARFELVEGPCKCWEAPDPWPVAT